MCFCNIIISELNKKNTSLLSKLDEYELMIKELENKLNQKSEELESLRRSLYGRKRERVIDDGNYLPGLELNFSDRKTSSSEAPNGTSGDKPKKVRKKTKRFVFPKSAERIEKIIDLDEEEKEGLRYIGEDVSEKLVYKPGYFEVHITRVKKYSKLEDGINTVVTPKLPKSAVPGSRLDESFLSHLLISKYCDHLPLYRLEQIYARNDFYIQRQTLSSLAVKAGELLHPLAELLKEEILKRDVLFTDDTPLKYMIKGAKKSNKGKNIKEGRAWVYIGVKDFSKPLIYYEFTPDRKHEHSKNMLQNYKGILHSDAFAAYENITASDNDCNNDIIWQPCWAHARRKFYDSLSGGALKLDILKLFNALFKVEAEIRALDFSDYSIAEREKEILKIRTERSEGLVDEIFSKAENILYSGEFLPKTKIYDAASYLVKRKESFKNFLTNPKAHIDNNLSERNIKPITIGRKNYLFAGSEKGGKTIAVMMSLVQTCKALGIEPQAYIEDVLRRINNTPKDSFYTLLPQNWKKL